MLIRMILSPALHFFLPLVLAASDIRDTYDYGRDIQSFLHQRDISPSDSQNAIVASIPHNGSIPLRLELRELQKNSEQWNLYLLAVSWMQWMNQSDPASWYAITGIHGAPFADYGGVKALPDNIGNGYCTHVSNLFPPWHRPYLALYEQTVYNITQMIAAWYPDNRRESFKKAAESFRLPYWDWAMKPPNGTSVFPSAVGDSPAVEVDGPNGKQNISNPLFSYTFKPLDPVIFEEYPFMYWNETKRRPMPLQGINATSDNTWVADTLDKGLDNIQQRLYTLFAKYDNYSTWSNEAWIPDGSNSSLDSIESLHDTIHLACGGNFGHMAIIAYSSFDPLFFLHHTNVDRLFAMWQIVNNESWLEPMSAILPTRTINTGDNQTSRTDLTPFYFNSTHFWNSDQVRDHKIFGYSYAEVVDGNRADTIAAINRLYRPASMNISMPNHVDISQKRSSMGLVVHDSSYREWTVNVDVNKFALGASFNIHIFLGKIPEYSAKWELADSNIGTLGVFAGGHAHADMGPLRIGGTIPLTRALIDLVAAGELPSLDPRHVKPFIQHNLGYAVMHNNGSSVESDRVDGLHINVVSSLVRLPGSESELVAWGEADIYFELY